MKTSANTTSLQMRKLLARISAIRRKRSVIRLTTGCSFAIATLAGMMIGETILDFLVDLPWTARACTLAGALGCAFFWLWKDAIRPLCKRMSDDAIALMIEHALPIFRTRYIASVQLVRASGNAEPPSLVRALVEQTASIASALDFRKVIKSDRMKRGLRSAILVVALASTLGYYGGEASILLIKRALLFNAPLPRKTHILTITGNRKIGIGEDVMIDVTASGILPSKGRIIALPDKKQGREFVLEQDPANEQHYNALIRSPQESFTYHVQLNDSISDTYRVETMLRPAVAELDCDQTYPAYINLPPTKRSTGELNLLVGSRLKVNIKASAKIGKGALVLQGLNKEVPLHINSQDQTRLSGEFDIPPQDLIGFSVRMVNTDGVASAESATYRIDLMPDRDPTVKITHPTRREELATNQATMGIGFEATDDFGVAKVALHYSINQTAEKTLDFDLGGRVEKNLTRRFDWKLSSLQPRLTPGDLIEFWMTVADANNLTGPGVGTSEHYQIRIVSSDDKMLDLQNRMRDAINGISEVTRTQEEATKALGETIFQKTNGSK